MRTIGMVILLSWIMTAITASKVAAASDLRVAFIVPDNQGPKFWSMVTDLSEKVATDLGVSLTVYYTDSHRFALMDKVKQVVNADQQPDYLIFRPFHGNAEAVFRLLEQHRIRFVTLEQSFTGEEAQIVSVPQDVFKYWIGQITYDNVKGGQLLTQAIIRKARQRYPDKTLAITGIGGDFDAVSTNRQRGLREQTKQMPKVVLNQIVPSYWDPNNVRENFSLLTTRYPDTRVFWAAGDELALTFQQLLDDSVRDHVIIGGFDWLPRALEQIKLGHYAASVGGHFLMGGIAVTKIVDHAASINRFKAPDHHHQFELIDTSNITLYYPFLKQERWRQLDYRPFASNTSGGKAPLPLTVSNMIQIETTTSENSGDHHISLTDALTN